MTEKPREKSKWSRYFRDSHLGVRLLVALILFLSLTFFIYSHGWWLSFSPLDRASDEEALGRSDSDDFEDEEEVAIARVHLPEDMGPVYKLKSHALETKRLEIKASLVEDRGWQILCPYHSFEEMNQLQDEIFTVLLDVRFSDQRTLHLLKLLRPLKGAYHCLPSSSHEGLTIFSKNFWGKIQNQVLDKGNFYPLLVIYAVDYFWKGVYFLEEDTSIQGHFREIVGRTVSLKNQAIQDGDFSLDEKESREVPRITIHRSLKETNSKQRNLNRPLFLSSSFILAALILFLGWLYLRTSHKKILQSVQKLCLYVTIIVLTLFLSKMADFFLPRHTDFFFMIRYPLYVPFAAILIAILLNAELALFSVFVLTIVFGLFLVADPNHFLVSNFTAGIVAILNCRGLRRRKEVFAICAKIWMVCVLVFFACNISLDRFWGFNTFIDSLVALAYLFLTSIFIISFLPIFESIFAIMTDVTLMEYMNPNNELLRRLSIEAPGTYQHCLVVGSIAEAAAQAIGANGLFCRVSTLYHDVGKLFNPHYFTENQMGELDIHQLLTPLESTQVIIDHVKQGEALARKHGLPQSFIDVIKEHHGRTLVYYFYCKQVEQMGGDKTAVDENQFRYLGPNPSSKESAIIMIADTLEAASRSLETVSEESIIELVERLIGEKLRDGQFKNCELNFKELEIIKQTMIKTLVVARHLRIKYPEKKF